MTNLKVLLNNIFPAGICDEICNYNLHCSKCKDLNDKERRYINFNYHFDYFKDKELTRVEKQIYFFKTRMEKSPIYLSNTNRTNTRQMKREIDVLMGTFKLKQEFQHNKLFLMAIKSFVKREWKTTYHFLKNFHDLTYMKYCKNNGPVVRQDAPEMLPSDVMFYFYGFGGVFVFFSSACVMSFHVCFFKNLSEISMAPQFRACSTGLQRNASF